MYTVITGGAGFIGSNILDKLNSKGLQNIIIVDNLGKSDKWQNLLGRRFENYFHKSSFLEKIEDDFHYFGKIETIIHMGACSCTTENNMDYLVHNNLHYSQIMCKLALEHKARFIYASSAATYGLGENGFDDTSDIELLKPINRYGYSKQLFDQWIIKNRLLDEVVGLKFFNVFGPNEQHKKSMVSMIYRGFEQIRENGKISLFKSNRSDYKNGEQKRDFIYVKDCVEIIWKLLGMKKINGIFNLGTGKARSWNDLAKGIFAVLNKKSKIQYINMPEDLNNSYQYFTEAKMNKILKKIPKFEFTPLEDGIRDYIDNYLTKK